MESSLRPLSGMYKPTQLKGLYYGPDVVKHQILSVLPSTTSKAFIVTGRSLATKTPLIKDLETLLSPKNYAGTFSGIGQHAPIAQLNEADSQVQVDDSIDTIISVGGGSPIDSAKAIVHRVHETSGKWLLHITIPTTLSAAECTSIAGYTQTNGVKIGIRHPEIQPAFIFYDPKYGVHTPPHLFLSTGIRALDHAVETQYYPYATWIPTKLMALNAIADLFRLLPKFKANPKDEDLITGLFLATYATLALLGQNTPVGIGLSHSLGYALGSPYGIPHGITSCMTLGHVVKLKARQSTDNAQSVAAILPYIGETPTGDHLQDADAVGDKILELVQNLGLGTTLTEQGIGKDQLDIITERATGLAKPMGELSEQEQVLVKAVRALATTLW